MGAGEEEGVEESFQSELGTGERGKIWESLVVIGDLFSRNLFAKDTPVHSTPYHIHCYQLSHFQSWPYPERVFI